MLSLKMMSRWHLWGARHESLYMLVQWSCVCCGHHQDLLVCYCHSQLMCFLGHLIVVVVLAFC